MLAAVEEIQEVIEEVDFKLILNLYKLNKLKFNNKIFKY